MSEIDKAPQARKKQGLSTKSTEYWARWDYTPEEWKQFDAYDWGRAVTNLLICIVVTILLCLVAAIFIPTSSSSPTLNPLPDRIGIFCVLLIPISLVAYALVGRQWWEARKRHIARKSDSRRVTIGNLVYGDQSLWIGGTFEPLQALFHKLHKVKMTENPPLLHLQRKHLGIRQASWYDTIRILVPQAHQTEVTELVKRFQTQTMASSKREPPREPA